MGLIELVTEKGKPTGLEIDSDFRYNPKRIKDAITSADFAKLVRLMGETKSTNVDKLSGRLYVPHAHFTLYSLSGGSLKFGCQKRSEKKTAFSGLTLPLTAGGHVSQVDFSGDEENAYKRGALREGIEELRNEGRRKEIGNARPFFMKESELSRINEVAGVYDFSEQGLPNKIYLEVFTAEYEPSRHGIIIPTNGTEEILWISLSEIEKKGYHKPLGEAGNKMINHFRTIRENLRMTGK